MGEQRKWMLRSTRRSRHIGHTVNRLHSRLSFKTQGPTKGSAPSLKTKDPKPYEGDTLEELDDFLYAPWRFLRIPGSWDLAIPRLGTTLGEWLPLAVEDRSKLSDHKLWITTWIAVNMGSLSSSYPRPALSTGSCCGGFINP